jgi:hypothetical protein
MCVGSKPTDYFVWFLVLFSPVTVENSIVFPKRFERADCAVVVIQPDSRWFARHVRFVRFVRFVRYAALLSKRAFPFAFFSVRSSGSNLSVPLFRFAFSTRVRPFSVPIFSSFGVRFVL